MWYFTTKQLWSFQIWKKMGFNVFEPQPSQLRDGYFKTYLEMTDENEIPKYKPINEKLGKCSICTNWWFSSLAETL